MQVNINGIWYDSEKQPIQIKLSQSDKDNIANMDKEKFNYICFPNDMAWENVKEDLKIDENGNPL